MRRGHIAPADQVVDEMLARIVEDRGISAGDSVALLVNGLGGTPVMELSIVSRSAVAWLRSRAITVARAWSGLFLTALEMAGCSLSLLRVDDDIVSLLDAPTAAPAWPGTQAGPASLDRPHIAVPGAKIAAAHGGKPGPLGPVLRVVCAALRREEHRLTALDQAVGDGDLGISLSRGAEAVERNMTGYDLADPAATLRSLSATLMRALGGTSGPLYAAFLLRGAAAIGGHTAPSAVDWAAAFQAGIDAIAELGGAAPGDRTMLDALHPAAAALQEALANGEPAREALIRAINAAQQGAERTASVVARRGRSSYLGERAIGHPDPGAEAVVVWLKAIYHAI